MDLLNECQLPDETLSCFGAPSELARLYLGKFWLSWKPLFLFFQILSCEMGYGSFWVDDGMLRSPLQTLTETNFYFIFICFSLLMVALYMWFGSNVHGPSFSY